MYTIQPYNIQYYDQWNDFVARSKNGTFLFHRDFMEYHADRFTDYSLLVFNDTKLVALLPANRVGDVVYSHQGLTYGGLVLKESYGVEKIEYIFDSIKTYLVNGGVKLVRLKLPPSVYHKEPSFEMDYLLYKNEAKLYSRDMNLAIDFKGNWSVSGSKLKHYRRVENLGLEIINDNNFKVFWQEVLEPRLSSKYNAKPVHTLVEILQLHDKFKENIVQYNAYYQGEIVAGITLFIFDKVIKSQYGATTPAGEKLRALDYLYIKLIHFYKDKMNYFDMGTVTSPDGYNSGLLKQKEELGCGMFLQDCYEVVISDVNVMEKF